MADKDLEQFMQMTKNKHADIENELDELEKEVGGNESPRIDDKDELNLSDLDEEEQKKEDELDLDDIENEKEKKIAETKQTEKEKEIIITKPETKEASPTAPISDIYQEKSEKLYHRVDKMSSMGVLNDELGKMDEIIAFKAKHEFDPDYFESKKDMIAVKMKEIENMISFEVLSLEEYKNNISNQLKWEEELINFANKDTKVTKEELEKILERINNRIALINSELTQEVPEEQEEEESNDKDRDKDKDEAANTTTTTSTVEITDNKIKLDPKVVEPVPNNSNKPVEIKNKKLYEEIKTKLGDYKDAAVYFSKIGSAKQEEAALAKAKEFDHAAKLFEEGKENQVDEFSLPIGLSPDFICGEDKQSRLNHFSTIIKEFSKRKNELNEALQARAEKLKTIDKKDFAKIKDAVKKDLDERKAKIDFYTKFIAKLTDYAKNPWVPAPLYSFVEEEEKTEKINEEIEPMTVEIHIGKSNYDKDNAYLYITMNLSENKTLTETVYFKNYPVYDHKIKWKLDKSEFNYLHRKSIEIQVWRKHWYWPFKHFLKGSLKIKLDPLKDISKISDSYFIKLESKRFEPTLEVSVSLRNPITGKEYNITSKPVMTVTKTFPPFRGDGVVENVDYPGNKNIEITNNSNGNANRTSNNTNSKSTLEEKSNQKISKDTKDSKNKTPNTTATTNNKPSKPSGDPIDPAEFTAEELNDPDIADNLNSVKVLQFKIDQVQADINKIEGRAPPKLREKLLKFKCRKNVLEQQLGDGISIDDYIVIMNKQLMKDQKLIKYFEQEKKIEQGKKVAERIPILIKEIQEAIDFSKSQKKK